MATWATKITVTDLSERRYSATATRTDGEDVWTSSRVSGVWPPEQTKEQFLTMLGNLFWAQFQADEAKRTAVAAFLTDCEALLDAGLDAKELE